MGRHETLDSSIRWFVVLLGIVVLGLPAIAGPIECEEIANDPEGQSSIEGGDPGEPDIFGDPSRFTGPCLPMPVERTPNDGNPNNDDGWILLDYCADGPSGCDPSQPPQCNRADDDSGMIFLPFFFNQYGEMFDEFWVNNNGTITFFDEEPLSAFEQDITDYLDHIIAPFWADADTGGADNTNLGNVWYKIIDDDGISKVAITWDNVGYYNSQGGLRNTFQVVLSDGNDSSMGFGNNVCFCYDDMQWTTGDANGGEGGFGGTPALVGINDANGYSFEQIGRFNQPGMTYDGGFGDFDGVDYLDGRGAGVEPASCFSVERFNEPPQPENVPPDGEYFLTCNEEFSEFIEFYGPEEDQTVFVYYEDLDDVEQRGMAIETFDGNPAEITFDWTPTPADVGSYQVEIFAEDDFYPEPGFTNILVTFNVDCPAEQDTIPLPNVSEEYSEGSDDARAGFSLSAAGDLNGDGLDDFIAGAPGYQGGPLNAPVGAGAVLVYFGSTDQAEREQADIVYVGVNEHDRVGTAVAGNFDFNLAGSDGLTPPDILIGAEQFNRSSSNGTSCNVGQACGNGLAYLIYFDPADYPNINDPSTTDYISLADVPGTIDGAVFEGDNFGDRAGHSVAGGGQMRPSGVSIAIGAPGYDVSDGKEINPDVGAAYLIFDQPLFGTYSLSQVANGDEDEIDGIQYIGTDSGDELGFSVAFPGDVVEPDGDDFAMGAPFVDRPGPTPSVDGGLDLLFSVGKAYVASGGNLSGGIIEVCDIGEEDEVGILPFVVDGVQIIGDQQGMQLGYRVSDGGDNLTNGDDDFLVSAPFYDYDDGLDVLRSNAGLVAQTASKMSGGIIEVCDIGEDPDADGPGIEGVRWVGEATGDNLGIGIGGLEDVTGNGQDDVGLGAPFADPNGLEDAGKIYIAQGRFAPATPALAGGTFGQFFDGIIEVCDIGEDPAGEALAGDTAGEEAGTSVDGVGDFDGDGSNDFAVGSPGAEGDDGQVWLVDEGTTLVPPQGNAPPVADASASQTLAECSVDLQGFINLDGSLSSDPDSTPGTNDDIVSYVWSEAGAEIATGVTANVAFGLGDHTVQLEVTDRAGESDTDFVAVSVVDTEEPHVQVTSPSVSGVCETMSVTVEAITEDTCDPNLDVEFDCGPDCPDPDGGPTYDEPGNYEVTVRATDDAGLVGSDVAIFSIDNVLPVVTIITPENGLEIGEDLPIDIVFDAVDPDGIGGGIVHEVIKLDDCVIYDGATYQNANGLLQDDFLPLTEAELCRLAATCGITSLDKPILSVEATDDCGNTGSDFRQFNGAVSLRPGLCDPIDVSMVGNEATVADWQDFDSAEYFDVLRGDVSQLGFGFNRAVSLGHVTCVEAKSTDSTTAGHDDLVAPNAGEAFFYVIRAFDGAVLSNYGRGSADGLRVTSSGDCPRR